MNFDWRVWTRGQWALRLVIVLGMMLALVARWPSLGAPPVWLVAAVLVLAVAWALIPESVIGVVALVVVGLSWSAGPDGSLPAGALVAALGILVAHLAALVVSYGPAALPVAPGVVLLWAVRGLALYSTALVVWVLARGVRELPESSTVWVLGVAVAASVVVVAAVATQAVMPQGDEE
jgi:hypothetical protein